MRITVMDRFNCVRSVNSWHGYEKVEAPALVISISCVEDKPPHFQARSGIYTQFFFFDDVEDNVYGCTLMDESDAIGIINAVKTYKDMVNQIIVHCDAGFSRSPAVAAALSRWLNGDDGIFFGPGYCPNRHVYRTMMNKLAEMGLVS